MISDSVSLGWLPIAARRRIGRVGLCVDIEPSTPSVVAREVGNPAGFRTSRIRKRAFDRVLLRS